MIHRNRFAALMLAVAAGFAACSDSAPTVPSSPLAGLTKAATGDSSTINGGGGGGGTPTFTGTGYIRGTVLGASLPGAGNDSLLTAPKIAGVKVTLYQRQAGTGDAVTAGAEVATTVTGTDGKFQLPVVPAGQYVVTFVPSDQNVYYGVYVHGMVYSNTGDWPWWIVLHNK